MVVTLSLNDVLMFILSIAGITLLIYLVISINNINRVIKDVKYILEKNKNSIDVTIASLPAIASNIKSISGDVREGMLTIASSVETLEKNIDKSSGRVTEKTEMALDYVQVLSEVIKVGLSYLKKRK
ncbi:MAG TPA: hypothetical protein VIK72_19080 [Clostridiaceae bacterium]